MLAQNSLEKSLVLGLIRTHVVNREFFEDHLILSERACFVGENIVNTTEFLRDLAVTGEGPLDLLVMVDAIAE